MIFSADDDQLTEEDFNLTVSFSFSLIMREVNYIAQCISC